MSCLYDAERLEGRRDLVPAGDPSGAGGAARRGFFCLGSKVMGKAVARRGERVVTPPTWIWQSRRDLLFDASF